MKSLYGAGWIIHRVYLSSRNSDASSHVDNIILTVSIAKQDTNGVMQLFEKWYMEDVQIYIELCTNERKINIVQNINLIFQIFSISYFAILIVIITFVN